jgi:hypothetical protein
MKFPSSTAASVAWFFLIQGLLLGFGCGGQSEGTGGGGDDDERGGSAGSPSAGSAGEGGTGVGGSSGAGTSGSAGMAGAAGMPNGAECASAADCRMVSDCCSCRAEPVSGPGELCPIDCASDACADGNVEPSEVECVMGRCVIARSCAGGVLCPALPPNCGEGRLPSILEGCWGPCLEVTECSRVPSCDDCSDAVCARFDGLMSTYHCVDPADGCRAGNYCECLGACTFDCVENAEGVGCSCPVC